MPVGDHPATQPVVGRLAMLGAGKMATALAGGFIKSGLVEAGSVTASDPVEAARDAFASAVRGAACVASNAEAARGADVLVVAAKPPLVATALADASSVLSSETLVISIAAGVSLATLATSLPANQPAVRVMPNTPCLIGVGASAYATGQHATPANAQLVEQLFSAVGIAAKTPEPLLDAVTGLSGSGPAFVYTVIEAMTDAAVHEGLPRALAAELAAQTVAGAAAMVAQTGEHPALLRDAVTSPGGTTAAGLAALEQLGARHAIGEAVRSATQRSRDLGAAQDQHRPPR